MQARITLWLAIFGFCVADWAAAQSTEEPAFEEYYADEVPTEESGDELAPRLAARAVQQDDPTLPPVIVRPNMGSSQGNYNRGGYGSGFGRSRGTIPWSSGAIRTDDALVGPYNQPVWTTQRPFAASRVYVLPPGQAQVEHWVRPTWRRGEHTEFRFLEEIAIGLPGRFQLDLYERWNIEPNSNNRQQANHEGVQIELRWALANWGVIPFNPTLYAEWVERGGPQKKSNKYELKLLLAEQFGPRLFYASNLILEQETRDEHETELAWSHAVSTPIIQRKLLAGLEARWANITTADHRSNAQIEFLIGPSLQYRPTNRTFLDVVGLFGTNSESPDAQMYVIFGYQFGTRSGPASGNISGPASTRGN